MSQDIHEIPLNDKAQERFKALRHKLKLDLQKPIFKEVESATLKHIQEVADRPIPSSVLSIHVGDEANQLFNKAKQEVNFVDSSFQFIESLKLPNELSLAIGLIISGHRTNNILEVNDARNILKAYVYKYGYGAINEKETRKETTNDQ